MINLWGRKGHWLSNHILRINCNSKREGAAPIYTYPHLRVGLIFNFEAGVRSLGAEAGAQRGFADAAPWIILLVVRGRVLEDGGKRTLQVHCSWNTEGPIAGGREG